MKDTPRSSDTAKQIPKYVAIPLPPLITISFIPIISIFRLENNIISLVFLLMTINSFYKHKLNILRILKGEEPKINIF